MSGYEADDTGTLIQFAKTLSSTYKEYLPHILTHMEKICRDALLIKSGVDLTGEDAARYIDGVAGISYEGLERILKSVESARHDIGRNISAENVMDSLLLRVRQARHPG